MHILHKLTGLEGETVLVRLDQIACAYPSNMYGAGENEDEFNVETMACTKISMISGDVLHVIESPEEILALSQITE
ncbi:hypothetical protein MTBPR1_170018 [Candidatus Terasakiella magnetica]|uniref:Uncharacterized protein n=1 Tax=Candidatus Terasakiella magnetica TaxID=1867952 RepID=A0A1C3RFS9_9PROT|nr:hypothetical protein [Candidatus Terasakiella magnetica]SCA56072.1 hypothetical protein MTBPR1_170018 [Candidatus Terasakiella magnetica]